MYKISCNKWYFFSDGSASNVEKGQFFGFISKNRPNFFQKLIDTPKL